MSQRGASARGFTLIEMLVMVTIVGLIASIAFPMTEMVARRTRERELREALRQIRTGIDQYKQAVIDGRIQDDAKSSGYPPSLGTLVQGVVDVKSANKSQKIYFMRRIPVDPMSNEMGVPGEQSWGLRSYASAPDNPQPGADVFDVYSRSTRIGLNGIPYRDW